MYRSYGIGRILLVCCVALCIYGCDNSGKVSLTEKCMKMLTACVDVSEHCVFLFSRSDACLPDDMKAIASVIVEKAQEDLAKINFDISEFSRENGVKALDLCVETLGLCNEYVNVMMQYLSKCR